MSNHQLWEVVYVMPGKSVGQKAEYVANEEEIVEICNKLQQVNFASIQKVYKKTEVEPVKQFSYVIAKESDLYQFCQGIADSEQIYIQHPNTFEYIPVEILTYFKRENTYATVVFDIHGLPEVVYWNFAKHPNREFWIKKEFVKLKEKQ